MKVHVIGLGLVLGIALGLGTTAWAESPGPVALDDEQLAQIDGGYGWSPNGQLDGLHSSLIGAKYAVWNGIHTGKSQLFGSLYDAKHRVFNSFCNTTPETTVQ